MPVTLSRIAAFAATALTALTLVGTGNAAPAAVPSATSQGLGSLAHAIGAGKLDRDVEAQLARNGFVDAIVTFRYADAMSASRSRTARARGTILEQVFAEREEAALDRAGTEARVLDAYDNLPASFVRFTSAEALLDVLNSSDVTGVRANRSVPVATSQSLQLIRQPQAAAAGHTGQGTYVAVLDTGVDYTRSPFGCSSPGVPSTCRVKVSEELDGDTETELDEDHFHGTNVAGVVSSVAPGAKILAFDVFRWMWVTDEYGDLVYELRSDSDDQLRAVNRVIDFKRAGWNVVALNMSLGGGHYTSACQTGLNFSVARDWGILPVVAAGNSAVVEGEFVPGIASPACDADAISVGAVFDSQQPGVAGACDASQSADLITQFSQSAPNLSLLAPGSCITAAGITMQGTSQAAPHVAGAVAVLAAAKFGSTLFYRSDAARIDSALRNAGPSIWDSRTGVTRRRLDVYAALTSLVGSTSGTDTTPPVMAVPVEQIETPSKASATYVPVRISWSATDSGGVAGYELSTSTERSGVCAGHVGDQSVVQGLQPVRRLELQVQSSRAGLGGEPERLPVHRCPDPVDP